MCLRERATPSVLFTRKQKNELPLFHWPLWNCSTVCRRNYNRNSARNVHHIKPTSTSMSVFVCFTSFLLIISTHRTSPYQWHQYRDICWVSNLKLSFKNGTLTSAPVFCLSDSVVTHVDLVCPQVQLQSCDVIWCRGGEVLSWQHGTNQGMFAFCRPKGHNIQTSLGASVYLWDQSLLLLLHCMEQACLMSWLFQFLVQDYLNCRFERYFWLPLSMEPFVFPVGRSFPLIC